MEHGSTILHRNDHLSAHREPTQKRAKTQQSLGKVMASVFWDTHDTTIIDYLGMEEPMSSDYDITLLESLKGEILGNGSIRRGRK